MTETYMYPWRDERWATDIYPIPAFPILAVRDVEASLRWYRDTMGFADVFTMRTPSGAPLLSHVRWCRYGDLLLRPVGDGPVGAAGVTLNFATVSADDIAALGMRNGAALVDGPTDRPWNARDVTFADPDGYRLTFTAPLKVFENSETPAAFRDIVSRLVDGAERTAG